MRRETKRGRAGFGVLTTKGMLLGCYSRNNALKTQEIRQNKVIKILLVFPEARCYGNKTLHLTIKGICKICKLGFEQV